jgi:succinoglycan biosynthesis protein ExoM
MQVSIVIPTQRRPVGLETAVRSALAQTDINPAVVELIIADNDTTPSARAQAEAFAKGAPFQVVYLHEPKAGVAHVRNTALRQARGEWIAFLDDDQEAPAGWLAALLAAQARLGADVVFGPVRARTPQAAAPHRAYLEWFFSREGPSDERLLDGYYGCGDSLIRRAALPAGPEPFSIDRNLTGGEDDLLFGVMQRAGAKFGWSPDAYVHEDPAPERQRLSYTLRRAFAYGQGPTEDCASQSPPDRIGVIRWMAIGLGQAAVFGALGGLQWLVGAPGRAMALDRAARGLGKALWWGPFKIQFYGRTAG